MTKTSYMISGYRAVPATYRSPQGFIYSGIQWVPCGSYNYPLENAAPAEANSPLIVTNLGGPQAGGLESYGDDHPERSRGYRDRTLTYEEQLRKLLKGLRSIDLSNDIYDQTEHFHAHGGSSDVFKAKSRKLGNVDVAVKRLRFHIYRNKDVSKIIFRELRVWSKLSHPNILPLLGYVMYGEYPALVSKWMVRGSVREYIEDRTNVSIMQMTRGIVAGLLYLHNEDIVHSDLKCENIFLSDSGEPLLADFGISRIITTTTATTSTNIKGSTRWMAVELLSDDDAGETHTMMTDIWAFGMVVYELLTRRLPFFEIKIDVRVSLAIMGGQLPSKPPSLDGEDGQLLWQICQECWRRNPFDRPQAASIFLKILWCEYVADEMERVEVVP
ncbi:kinase-like protein [Schizopora paradoxa]|uniref:Kinase-like protein n=1 Tax=Schizopora paradoxa TaxID=27342 RepID=A0A0H2RUL7_9AGAM|nr:kinase-like protein [Schizopora paradoxa]